MKIKERLITVSDIVTVLRRYFLLIIACALLFGAAGYLYAVKTATVTYTATSGVYVQTADVDMEVGPTANQISLGRALALSCKDAIKNEAVYQNVKAYFAEQRKDDPAWEDLSSVSNSTLRDMVACTVASNSQYVDITVTASTASMAVHVANAVAGVLEVSVIDVIGNCRIEPTAVARTAIANVTSEFSPTSLSVTAAVVGAFLTFCVLFAFYFFDPHVRVTDMTTCYEGVALLGHLYTSRRKNADDAISTLRANLLSRIAGKDSSVLLLSGVSRKTSCRMLPLALATSFADTGRRVLLINGMSDDEGASLGLADAVAGKREAIRSATKNLDCLPFGILECANADLLGSREFAAFLDAMRAEYDVILLCTAPVCEAAEAATAAPHADGVLLATTPARDKRAALNTALSSLDAVDAALLGTVASGI
ncbi:MAG: hypothetical protein IJ009_02845 [Clostridia bacterium]|nr:hypothetical protein [Clostridia bacterium]